MLLRKYKQPHVYGAENAAHLDHWFRRKLQDPAHLLTRYITPGMITLDLGCGTGFFSIAMAKLAGDAGKVFALDLQIEMLEKLQQKLNAQFSTRIELIHGSVVAFTPEKEIDFALAAYVFHELTDQAEAFNHLRKIIGQGKHLLILEPNIIVSKRAFQETIRLATDHGFVAKETVYGLLSKKVLLKRM